MTLQSHSVLGELCLGYCDEKLFEQVERHRHCRGFSFLDRLAPSLVIPCSVEEIVPGPRHGGSYGSWKMGVLNGCSPGLNQACLAQQPHVVLDLVPLITRNLEHVSAFATLERQQDLARKFHISFHSVNFTTGAAA